MFDCEPFLIKSPVVVFTLLLSGALAFDSAAADEMTTQSLLAPYVERVGEEYDDVTAALTVFKNGQFDDARELLQKAIAASPQLPPAGILLTRMFMAAGEPTRGLAELQRVAEAYPQDPEAFLGITEVAIAQGRFADAELALNKAVQLNADSNMAEFRKTNIVLRIRLGQATLAEHREDLSEAARHLQLIVDQEIRNRDAVLRLARSRFKLSEHNAVTDLLQKHWETNKTSIQHPQITLGLLWQESGHRQRAATCIQSAADQDRSSIATQSFVTTWALESGNMELAESCAERSVALSNSSIQSRLLLALVSRYRSDYTAARTLLEEVHLESPANLAAVIELSIVLSHIEGMENRSLQYAQVGIKLQPDLRMPAGRNAAVALARILHKFDGESHAEEIIHQVLKAGPISVESSYYAAMIVVEKNPDAAKQLLQQVIKSDRIIPDIAAARALLESLR